MSEPVRLVISLGERAGLRPQDVVGAIVNEAGIRPGEVGQVEIAEEHTRVDVAGEVAQRVLAALRKTTLRGRRFAVHVDRDGDHGSESDAPPRGARTPTSHGRFGRPARAPGPRRP